MTVSRKTIYTQRNACAAALARLTLQMGGKAGVGRDKDGWLVLYVDTPNGQVSWHIWDHDEHLLDGLPNYSGEWDGTFKGQKGEWCKWPLPSPAMERFKAENDRMLFGNGFLVNGKHIPVQNVEILT